jgi:ribonuclease HI
LLIYTKYAIVVNMNFYQLRFDGSCGPKNPGGTAAYGYILRLNNTIIKTGHGIIGTGPEFTNNVAEHYAVAEGMRAFLERYQNEEAHLTILGDSKLVTQQLNGHWRIKEGLYMKEAYRAIAVLNEIKRKGVPVRINWVPREHNQECDDLSKIDVHSTFMPK